MSDDVRSKVVADFPSSAFFLMAGSPLHLIECVKQLTAAHGEPAVSSSSVAHFLLTFLSNSPILSILFWTQGGVAHELWLCRSAATLLQYGFVVSESI